MNVDYLITPVPVDSLHVNVRDVGVEVSGLWSYELDNILHIHDHGTFKLLAGNLGMEIETVVGADNRGMPIFSIKQCSGSFRNLQLEIHSEHSWIINKFKDTILKEINKPCEILIGQVMGEIAKKLNQYDPQIPIGHEILFDLRLLGTPAIETQGIRLKHKGEFFFHGDTTEAPFKVTSSFLIKRFTLRLSLYLFCL